MARRWALPGGLADRGAAGQRPARVAPAWLRPAGAFVGRQRELDAFDAVARDFVAGRGRSVWVMGEPGIGKSTFLAEALGRIDHPGRQVFAARNADTANVFPLRPLLDAFGISPGVTDPPRLEIADRLWGRRQDDPMRPGDAVAAAAEMLLMYVDQLCASGPVIVVVDDMQWADDITLAVWGRLDEVTQQLPLLLLAAARPVPRREEVDRLYRWMSGHGLVTIQLDPLADDEVGHVFQQVASAQPGPRLRELLRQAGGNPLYVRELAEALIGGSGIRLVDGTFELSGPDTSAPRSLTAAIAAKLSFLSEPTARVLRTAAVLGSEFELEQLSMLVGEPPIALASAVDEALSAGVLAEAGSVLVFRHGLILQALYESIPAPMRHAMHRQAAQALAEAGEPPESVITHLRAAPGRVGGWALDWLMRVSASMTTRAPQAALELLRRVRAEVDPDDPRRLVLDTHVADALLVLGDYPQFHQAVIPILGEAQDPEIIGRMSWSRAYAFVARGEHDPALAVGEAALARADLPPRWQARVLGLNAASLVGLGRLDEALTVARQAETRGEQVADRFAMGFALFAGARATGIATDDSAAVLAMAERGLALIADDPAATDVRLLLHALQIACLDNLGRPEETAHALGEALTLAERAGTPNRLAMLRVLAAEINFTAGRWDDALPELDAAMGGLGPRSESRAMLAGIGSLIAVHRGDEALLKRYRSASVELTVDKGGFGDNMRVAEALIHERDGRPDQALDLLVEQLELDSTGSFPALSLHRCVVIPTVVRLALDLGRREVAEAAAAACATEAAQRPDPLKTAAAGHSQGLVTSSAEPILTAASCFERRGWTHWRAMALEDAAVLLAASGDLSAARNALADAIDVYSELDASWDIRRAEARVRPYGVRRGARGARQRPSTGWESLTRSEVTVANLVAAGRSNPEIAAELYLSRNTVQSHVSHILTKLGCRSRHEVAAFIPLTD